MFMANEDYQYSALEQHLTRAKNLEPRHTASPSHIRARRTGRPASA